ncbi:MAG: hypothetical protein DPW16_19335 [Chloroflexi bacterium]|nr:hypothetical protein [Chloroflexota bacterium]
MTYPELEYIGQFGEGDVPLRFLDKERVFTAKGGTTAKIWKLPQFELLHDIKLPYENARYWQLSPNGEFLALGIVHAREKSSSLRQVEIVLLSLPEFSEVTVFDTGKNFGIDRLVFSPDSNFLVMGSVGSLFVYDLVRLVQVNHLMFLSSHIKSVDFSPDSKYVVASDKGNDIGLWNMLQDYWPIAVLKGHTHSVRCVRFSPNGELIASASWDHTVRIWSAIDGEELVKFPITGSSFSVAFSPDGALIAGASTDGTISIWNVAKFEHEITLSMHRDWVEHLEFSSDGSLLMSVARLMEITSGGGSRYLMTEIKFWDVRDFQELVTFWGNNAILSPDGNLVALDTPSHIQLYIKR